MKIKYLIYLVVIVVLSSCESDRCFKKAGNIAEELHTFDTISKLYVNGLFDVELVSSEQYFIEVIAPEQVLKGVSLELSDSNVTCYNYNNCFWRRDFDRPLLRVHYPYIHEIIVKESSYLYSVDTITSDVRLIIETGLAEADIILNAEGVFFYINKTSGGRYNFYGKAENAFLMSYNAGLFDMSELEVKRARVLNYSTIDMKVHVTDLLKVEIHDEGNILYKGCPEIQVDSITSSGRPIKVD